MCIVMFKEENIEIGCKLFCFLLFMLVIIFLENIYSLLFLFLYLFLANRKKDDGFVITMFYLFILLGVAIGFVNGSLCFFKLCLILAFFYYFSHYFKENKRSFLVKNVSVSKMDEENDDIVNVDDGVNFYGSDSVDYEVNDNRSNLDYYDSDEIVVSDNRINEINYELKKGHLLKEDDIKLIKSHLVVKEQDELNEKKKNDYLRFVNVKKKSNYLDFTCWKNKFNSLNLLSFKKNNSNRKGIFKLNSYKWQYNLDDINGIYIVCHLVILLLAIVVE